MKYATILNRIKQNNIKWKKIKIGEYEYAKAIQYSTNQE